MEERRSHPRFACDIEAFVELPDGDKVPARTVDLSFSGICLVAAEHIKPRTPVNFHLRLIFQWAESEGMSIPGEVVWSTEVEGEAQIGARFDKNMSSVSWTRLDVLLQFLAGEIAQPGPS
jgi:hypothetical protein